MLPSPRLHGAFHGYRQLKIARGHWAYEPLLRALVGLIPWHCRVIDIGGGPGHYLSAMQSMGWFHVRCIDGTPHIDFISRGISEFADLSTPCRDFWGCADWGLCIEVGEHVYGCHESQLLDNLAAIPTHGLVLTWSTMAGYGHVNLRSEGYIAQRLYERGWIVDDEASRKLKDRLGRRFKSWAMVLHRKES